MRGRKSEPNSAASVAARVGRSKSQTARLKEQGLVTPENEEIVGDLYEEKLRAEIADKRKSTEIKQVKLDREARLLIPMADVAGFVERMTAIFCGAIDFALFTRLPQINAGADAAQQRKNNETEANEIRRQVKDEALRFLKEIESIET